MRLKMVTRAHALLEVLNQGAAFLDSLDDLMAPGIEVIDGTRVWEPPLAQGVEAAKAWFAAWLGAWRSVAAAATGSAVTPASNKAFVCFRLLLADPVDGGGGGVDGGSAAGVGAGGGGGHGGGGSGGGRGRSAEVDGCFLVVFRIDGRVAHLVAWRNGAPAEEAAKFIAGGGGSGGGRGAGSKKQRAAV